jgi:hypothetical protein
MIPLISLFLICTTTNPGLIAKPWPLQVLKASLGVCTHLTGLRRIPFTLHRQGKYTAYGLQFTSLVLVVDKNEKIGIAPDL